MSTHGEIIMLRPVAVGNAPKTHQSLSKGPVVVRESFTNLILFEILSNSVSSGFTKFGHLPGIPQQACDGLRKGLIGAHFDQRTRFVVNYRIHNQVIRKHSPRVFVPLTTVHPEKDRGIMARRDHPETARLEGMDRCYCSRSTVNAYLTPFQNRIRRYSSPGVRGEIGYEKPCAHAPTRPSPGTKWGWDALDLRQRTVIWVLNSSWR